ncbi:MAG: preprotein translocase subunit SecY [Prevotellaceae bacterium]|jgi:preprotein translocase subunit SecY|nr:preprotein translocase subunit SecY [Prevotellaceae bacterium]
MSKILDILGIKRFVQTIQNIYRIEELRTRIGYTLLLLLVFRFGSFVVLPGIDPTMLKAFSQSSREGWMGMLDLFSGGAFSNASVFALGVMPYISASIVIQLMTIMVPAFQRIQREGESGRRKINQYTRLLTLAILAIQCPMYLYTLKSQLPVQAFLVRGLWSYTLPAVMCLISGTMFVMWLGERITDRGLGNGISLLIMIGIIARLPHALLAELETRFTETTGGPLLLIVEILILMLIFMVCIALVQAVRRIPVQYARRVVGNKQYGGARQYIPLKINAAGVMPIIFAQALMFVPLMFTNFDSTRGFAQAFQPYGFWYTLVSFLLVIAFTYFYTAITVNPTMMAEDMKKNGGFIPGIKPGKKTAEYIDGIMSKITLPGSIFLGFVAILPTFAYRWLGVNQEFATFYGGTSLLILVGVVLDTLQQIESHLLLRHYDGLMKTGRLKGRTPS